MYTLKTSASFDSAHFLSGYEGKCSNIHGHRWTVEIEVSGDRLETEGSIRGMLVDFSELKDDLGDIADSLDHCLIIEDGSLKDKTLGALDEEGFKVVSFPFRPTAENFARYFCGQMIKKGYNVSRSTVYETPKNCASYEPDSETGDGK